MLDNRKTTDPETISTMSLHHSADALDYDAFSAKLQQGQDILAVDKFGNTVLHVLGRHNWKQSLADSVSGFFKPRIGLIQWVATIRSALHGKTSFHEFASIRNKALDSCMHAAIDSENWEIAYALHYTGLNYQVYPQCLTRNAHGLNEYELFLVRYGISGEKETFDVLFKGFSRTLLDVKIALKAVKVVRLTKKFDDDKEVFLSPDHKLFSCAADEDYPSPFANFSNESDLTALYDENGLVNPSVLVDRKEREAFDRFLKDARFPDHPDLHAFIIDWSQFMRTNGFTYDLQRRVLYDFFCLGSSGSQGFILEELAGFEKSGGCDNPSHRKVFSQLVARCNNRALDESGEA